ncbi:hypothetical protein PFISCL1PPCAC_953, partial [Pristionchus fissidentatus]
SISTLTRLLSEGKLDFSQARPFDGTIEELREKVVEILRLFHVEYNIVEKFVDAILMLNSYGNCTSENRSRLSAYEPSLSNHSNIVKIFINRSSSE